MSDWRFHVQSLPDGGWLHRDLPLAGVEVTRELSGPGGLTGTIPVEVPDLLREDGSPLLIPWWTAVWAEASGQIRGGGIVVRAEANGPTLPVECVGIAGYPQGMPWLGSEYNGVQIDPLSAVRRIWAHLQSYPNGDLGVVVDGTTSPVRIGTESEDVEFTTGAGQNVSFEAGPFKLNPWTTSDLGREIDKLAADTPFDYLSHTAWDGERLAHRLELAYPRRGSRRHDLRFVVGENVTADPAQVMDGDDYASEVLALGAGEGRDMVRTVLSAPRGGLRRVVTVADKSARSVRAVTDVARRELAWRSGAVEIDSLTVAESPLAEVASIEPGDEVFVQSDAGWLELGMWVRVLAVSTRPEELGVATLSVARSEAVA